MKEYKTCYISAPFGTELKILKEVLNNEGISLTEDCLINTGYSIADSIKKAINKSDLVCGIIKENLDSYNVFFELGIAYTKNKPIVIFMDENINIPIYLKHYPYTYINIENKKSLTTFFDFFLNYGQIIEEKKDIQRKRKKIPLNLSWVNNQKNILENGNEAQFLNIIEKIFKQAGYQIQSQPDYQENRPDFAFWAKNLEKYFENPILIEIKSRLSSNIKIYESEIQLRNFIKEIGGDIGLIIYYDTINQDVLPDSKDYPLILKFSFKEFVNSIETGEFENLIINKRNKIAHGRL